jgi:hypothetical protein
VYGTDLGAQPNLFADQFREFARRYPDWRVAISWGEVNQFRAHLHITEPVTARVLPSIPIPNEDMGTPFSIATVLRAPDGHEEHAMGFFRAVPLREIHGRRVKYALAFDANSMDQPLSEADVITMYLATTAVPYADHMIVEQHLSLNTIDLNQALPMGTLREAKNAGRSDGEALNLVVPRLVRALIATGETFKFIGRRHFTTNGAGGGLPPNLQEANRIYIQYHFEFPSLIEAEKSRNSSLN